MGRGCGTPVGSRRQGANFRTFGSCRSGQYFAELFDNRAVCRGVSFAARAKGDREVLTELSEIRDLAHLLGGRRKGQVVLGQGMLDREKPETRHSPLTVRNWQHPGASTYGRKNPPPQACVAKFLRASNLVSRAGTPATYPFPLCGSPVRERCDFSRACSTR